MPTTIRPPKPPIVLDQVVADGNVIRDMARANGPYWQPGRMLATSKSATTVAANEPPDDEAETTDFVAAMVGPTFRGQWAFGEPLVEGAAALLNHQGFIDAAAQMYETNVVVPEQVYVNLSTPVGRQGFSHTDIPEFRGVDRTNAPAWLLTAMGASRRFEAERIHIVTAVAWFYQGEAGGLRYWPEGMDGPSIHHTDTWNTAVVGDNDFMPHEVQRIGPRGSQKPDAMTIRTELRYAGATTEWQIVDNHNVLATYRDDAVRLSLSWKAKVYRDEAEKRAAETGADGVTITEAIERLGADLAASSAPEELAGDDPTSDALRQQLNRRYSTYVPS